MKNQGRILCCIRISICYGWVCVSILSILYGGRVTISIPIWYGGRVISVSIFVSCIIDFFINNRLFFCRFLDFGQEEFLGTLSELKPNKLRRTHSCNLMQESMWVTNPGYFNRPVLIYLERPHSCVISI